MRRLDRVPARFQRAALILFAAAFYSYFLVLTRDGLNSWFSGDDLMNLHYYWSRPASELIWANLAFFSDYYRPMGGAFYRGIHSISGFDPLPYRIAALAILSFNLWTFYRIVLGLSRSREIGVVALMLTGLHGSFVLLYYDTGMIYDVLAFFFYFGAFALYLHRRTQGRMPGFLEMAILLCLYIAAINSKEIAVTLPLAVALHEVLWHPPLSWKPVGLLRWISGPARFASLGLVVSVIYVVGKMLGEDSLFRHPGYRPHFSIDTYLETYSNYLSQLSYSAIDLSPAGTLALLTGVIFLAVLSRKRHLIWASLFIITAVLPIAFIPARHGFAFYIPSAGWSIYVAGLVTWLRDLLVRGVEYTLARLRQREPAPGHKLVLRLVGQGALIGCLALWLLPMHARALEDVLPLIRAPQERNRLYCAQIHELIPEVKRGARILVLNDPYPSDTWDLHFLIRLSYGDRTLEVDRLKTLSKNDTPVDSDGYDYVLDFVSGRFVLRTPDSGKTLATGR